MSTFLYDFSLPHLEKFMVCLQFQIYLCLFYPSIYLRNGFKTPKIHQRNFPHEGWTDITLNLIHEYWYRLHWKIQGESDSVFEVSLEDKNSSILLKQKIFEMTKKFYIWILIKEKNFVDYYNTEIPDTILISNVMSHQLKNPIYHFGNTKICSKFRF